MFNKSKGTFLFCYIWILGISMDVDCCINTVVVECDVPCVYMYKIIKLFLTLLSLSLLSECSYTSLGSTYEQEPKNSFTRGLTTYIGTESSSITCTKPALHKLQVCEADLEYSCTKQGNSKHNMPLGNKFCC